jgi:RNA recognition motif-containing protein
MGKKSTEEPQLRKKRKLTDDCETFIPLKPSIQVIASGFPESITSQRIQKLFKPCGNFSVNLSSPGVAFLLFDSESSALKALELNQGSYKGKTLFLNLTSDLPSVKREKPIATPVFVGNLKSNTTEDQLRSFFSGAGKIKSIRLNTEKGFAHIDFTSKYSADLAAKLGGKLNGQKIRVEVADKKSN